MGTGRKAITEWAEQLEKMSPRIAGRSPTAQTAERSKMDSMPFDREIVEARLALKLIDSGQMPTLAVDALEAGLDGPAIRRLAALVQPTWFEVNEVLENAAREMKLEHVAISEAARRLMLQRAQEILHGVSDPLRSTRLFEQLWIRAGYPADLSKFGTLDDEVHVAKSMGRSEQEIHEWLTQRLKELVDPSP